MHLDKLNYRSYLLNQLTINTTCYSYIVNWVQKCIILMWHYHRYQSLVFTFNQVILFINLLLWRSSLVFQKWQFLVQLSRLFKSFLQITFLWWSFVWFRWWYTINTSHTHTNTRIKSSLILKVNWSHQVHSTCTPYALFSSFHLLKANHFENNLNIKLANW